MRGCTCPCPVPVPTRVVVAVPFAQGPRPVPIWATRRDRAGRSGASQRGWSKCVSSGPGFGFEVHGAPRARPYPTCREPIPSPPRVARVLRGVGVGRPHRPAALGALSAPPAARPAARGRAASSPSSGTTTRLQRCTQVRTQVREGSEHALGSRPMPTQPACRAYLHPTPWGRGGAADAARSLAPSARPPRGTSSCTRARWHTTLA